ncbi:putative hydantoinase/oxoprolinase family protein [Paenibacillus sp. 1182]|uniref:hypothetical protein n=1 Tax=Paenibacillus sp. 1182 TaxID=2806565 RepID=UPI000F9A91C5|nr:hypothetical protein [Paenibacillus sp. 1182]MBP1308049.1 putative hydantoinase/oxoprolinase family protein [Paenibacillus sp. 1182]
MNTIHLEIQKLERSVLEIVDKIDQVQFEELVDFTDKRERLVQNIMKLKDVLTQEEKEKLKELGKFDASILMKMNRLKIEASQWLLKQGTIQEQKSAYNASYTPDSLFFDRKN